VHLNNLNAPILNVLKVCGNVKINISGQDPVAVVCEDDNEISYSIKRGNFLITHNMAAHALLNQM